MPSIETRFDSDAEVLSTETGGTSTAAGVGFALGPTNMQEGLQSSKHLTVLANTGIAQCGFTSIWQGAAGVANAVSQLNNLYANKLQFSDFDAG